MERQIELERRQNEELMERTEELNNNREEMLEQYERLKE